MSTAWLVDGTDVRKYGYNIRSTDGWEGFPSTRIARNTHAFRHGDKLGARGWYEARRLTLAMDVFPTAADGTVTLAAEEHIQDNLDALFGLFHTPGRLITLQKQYGTGPVTRQIQGAITDAFDVRSGVGPQGRTFVARFELPYPFWHELPIVNLTSQTGAPSVSNGGNAPVADWVMTFTAAGRVTWPDGSWIEVDSVAGGNVVVDAGAMTVTQAGSPADARLSQGQEWWPDFEPGSNSMTITATVNISYYPSFF